MSSARGRLVEDDEARLQHHRAGDRDPLALAAGELVRVAVRASPGRARPPRAPAPPRGRRSGALAPSRWTRSPSSTIWPTDRRGLSDCRRGPGTRSASARAAAAARASTRPWICLAAEPDGARRCAAGAAAPAERGLARAALADHAQRLALAHREADAVHRLDVADRPPQQAALDREVHLDVPRRRTTGRRRRRPAAARPWARPPAGAGCRDAGARANIALDRPGLDDLARPVMTQTRSATLRTIVQVVGDQQQRHAEPALQIAASSCQDLRLDGDVERGGRLVGDQQVGLVGERHGDHHPLALAARELVRVGVEPRLGVGDADAGAAARACAPAPRRRPRRLCSSRASPTCRSTVCSGLSEVIGSWKIMPTRSPRTWRRHALVGADQLLAVERMLPAGWRAVG